MSTKTKKDPPTTAAVLFDAESKPGVKAVGEYLPGVAYTVPIAEAVRLVQVKGFRAADEASASAITAATAATTQE